MLWMIGRQAGSNHAMMIGGSKPETALVSDTHPFPGPDNRDRAESASGYRGWIMRNSLIDIWLPH
jgi:hypothetical protein